LELEIEFTAVQFVKVAFFNSKPCNDLDLLSESWLGAFEYFPVK